MSEKIVGIASALYSARSAMRGLWKEEYPEKVAQYQKYIHGMMEKRSLEALPATMALVEDLQEKFPHKAGMEQALILAAYVEMIEPSEKPAEAKA